MQIKAKLLLTTIVVAINLQINAQGVNSKWDKSGDAPINDNSSLGTTNSHGFKIITNSQPAVNVATDGTFNFIRPVNFTNKLKFDSLRILKYLDVDSIHCRTLKVGNSWTINDAGPLYGGTRPYNQQTQNATDRKRVLEV